jgi:hypothetical protein
MRQDATVPELPDLPHLPVLPVPESDDAARTTS